MKKLLPFLIILFSFSFVGSAQMEIDGNLYYGNEWIDFDQRYFKIKISETGLYRVNYSTLKSAGIPIDDIQGKELQLFNYGQEQFIITSTDDDFGSGDYIEFYAKKNEGFLDSHLFEDPSDQMNLYFSLITDENAYFLTWETGSNNNQRYTDVENDLTGNVPLKEEYYIHEDLHVFHDIHFSPTIDTKDVRYSRFLPAEGFGTDLSVRNEIIFETSNINSNGPAPYVDVRIGTIANANHKIELSFNDDVKFNEEFYGLATKQYNVPLSLNELDNENSFFVKGRGSVPGASDRHMIAHGSLFYPRDFVANGSSKFEIQLPADNFRKYFEIEDFDNGSSTILLDPVNGLRIEAETEGNTAKILLPGLNSERTVILLNSDKEVNLNVEIEAVDPFINIDNEDPEYLLLTSKALNSGNAIKDYADFRSSSLGGEYDTYIIEYEQIRDQFGYGIHWHPKAINNFAMYAKEQWPNLRFCFILGKSLEYQLLREGNNSNYIPHVPTHGDPGSDHLLFAEKGDNYGFVAVGRIAANDVNDVTNYLEKNISYIESKSNPQSIDEKDWTKQVLHLAGGDAEIKDQLLNNLNDMGDIISANKFAANVTTFQKVSNSPTQNPLSEQILNRVNDGVSIMTFFGHSSAGTFDFSIEDPSQYANFGKLPLVVSLGCHSGNIHTTSGGISENFVLQEETGAIAFLASSGAAYIFPQAAGGRKLYDLAGEDFYGQPIGEIIRDVMIQNEDEDLLIPSWEYRLNSLHEQLTLHGDPAIELNSSPGPDFIVDFSSINNAPKIVSTNLDSFELNFEIVNLGSKFDGNLQGQIIHKYGTTKKDTLDFEIVAPSYRGTVSVMMEQKGIKSIGKNSIEIILDHDDLIPEFPAPEAESNNTLKAAYGTDEGYCFFVFDNNASPIHPKEFGIVNSQGVRLISSTNNALLPVDQYLIEIDTTELFNSNLKMEETVTSGGGMIEWVPGISLTDNTVYYWRIKNISDTQTEEIWNYSSFIFLENESEGWNQSHYYQWIKDDFTTSLIDEKNRNFEFIDDFKTVAITNGVWPVHRPSIVYQNEPYEFIEFNAPVKAGVWVAVFDEFTGEPMLNGYPSQYGSTMNTDWATNFVPFPYWSRTAEERKPAIDFMNDIIEDGAYVVFMTIQEEGSDYFPQDWASDPGKNLVDILEEQGSQRVRELANLGSVPYLYVYKKNDTDFDPIEIIGTIDESFSVDFEIAAKWFEGSIDSEVIGPVSEWESLIWELGIREDSDSLLISIIGIDVDGNETILEQDVKDEMFSLSNIDASQYPYLKLRFYAEDSTKRTAPYINYWRVLYKELPEAMLNTNDNFVFTADTLGRGETLELRAMAENIKDVDLDSLLVKYNIVDVSNNEEISFTRMAPLKGLEKIPINFSRSVGDLEGLYELRVEINADREQKEEVYFNNLGVLNFFVRDDYINPLLDVTFDGVHIMNGDIVSPNPIIVAELRDNSGVPLSNPEDFILTLLHPDGTYEDIDVLGPNVTFYPADTIGENIARLEFNPDLISGDYILYVQAKDASGNFSGDHDAAYEFTVITESKISNVLNYPNPFSTSTQFIFTITGSTVPENFHIKIMTLSGKVVRELTPTDLGPLHVGVNRSGLKWDGKDDYGSQLANGVYLYKAYSSFDQLDDSDFEISDIDSYYKKGFGKLVILK